MALFPKNGTGAESLAEGIGVFCGVESIFIKN
jgi:hypothetical protein